MTNGGPLGQIRAPNLGIAAGQIHLSRWHGKGFVWYPTSRGRCGSRCCASQHQDVASRELNRPGIP
jgi:hypothetical protein